MNGTCTCEARGPLECMCGAWHDGSDMRAHRMAKLDATIAQLRAALVEACDRFDTWADVVGGDAFEHDRVRIAALRKIAEGK